MNIEVISKNTTDQIAGTLEYIKELAPNLDPNQEYALTVALRRIATDAIEDFFMNAGEIRRSMKNALANQSK